MRRDTSKRMVAIVGGGGAPVLVLLLTGVGEGYGLLTLKLRESNGKEGAKSGAKFSHRG